MERLVDVCVYMWVFACMDMRVCMSMYEWRMCVCMYGYICVCVYACVSVGMYV